MPVRNMIYDALNYGKQVNEAKKRHETNKENMSANPKVFSEALTVELLEQHQKLSEECK